MKEGDFVRVEYTTKVANTGKVFDTTSEETAKKEGVYDEKKKYGKTLIVLGKGMLFPALENEIVGMNVGEHKIVKLPPEKAFGERNVNLIKMMPTHAFKEKNINPYPGMPVELDGIPAIIKSTGGGRTMVDFNHPLAGEAIIYDIKVIEKIEEETEKVLAIADEADLKLKKENVSVSQGKIKIKVEKELTKDSKYLVHKLNFMNSIEKMFDGIKEVDFEESYAFEKEVKSEKKE